MSMDVKEGAFSPTRMKRNMKISAKIIGGILGGFVLLVILANIFSPHQAAVDYNGPLTVEAVNNELIGARSVYGTPTVVIDGSSVVVYLDHYLNGWSRMNLRYTSGSIFEILFQDPRISKVTVSISTDGVDQYGNDLNIRTGEFMITKSTASKVANADVYSTNLDEIADFTYYHPNTT